MLGVLQGWEEQYRRMIRSFRKLGGVYNNTEVYDDDLCHFFQDVWHLKDWLKNDPAVPQQVRRSVETDVQSVRALRLAADLANGSKHFELRSPRWARQLQTAGHRVLLLPPHQILRPPRADAEAR